MKDKLVFITGGSSGIGLAVARLLVSGGSHVVIFARGRDKLDEALSLLEKERCSEKQIIGRMQMDVSVNDVPAELVTEEAKFKGHQYILSPDMGTRRLRVSCPFFGRTFPVKAGPKQVGVIEKKWGGIWKEAFTQADNFRISFEDSSLTEGEKKMIVATTLLIDMDRFETHGKED